MNTETYLKNAIDGAPLTPGRIAPDLRGWWTSDGYYLCASCAGRIMARGCKIDLHGKAEPVWADLPVPYGVCVTCQEEE